MRVERWLTHTVAHHWPATDSSNEGFLCVCGELLVDQGEATKWEPPIIQMSEHLKKMNAPPTLITLGNNDPKPEKPPGDDPRAGHEIVTPNGWRRFLGLNPK